MIVNVQALDLGLGSGGFDVVHANLTRGPRGRGRGGAHVMKLNYTSLQHAVEPVDDERLELPLERPVAVLALHGQLAAVAWAFAQRAPGERGSATCRPRAGRCPAGTRARSRDAARSAACSRATSPPARRSAARARRSRPPARCTTACTRSAGTPPSAARARGSSGRAPRSATAGWRRSTPRTWRSALGCPTLLVARMSSGDERARHRGDLPPHAHGPRPAARAGDGRAARGHALAGRHGSARGLGAVFGAAETGAATDARRRAPGADRPPRLAPRGGRPAARSPRAASRPRRWAAGPREDPLFFGAALAGGRRCSPS